jgi:lactate dehydrogenase-like 2-hydroxyacid dehydrogenase
MTPEILVTGRVLPATRAALERLFTVHLLPNGPARTEFLAAAGRTIRGIAGAAGADAALIAALPNLEIIANFGVGYDWVDVPAAKARGIPVTNTPDVLTDEVADLAMALILDSARQISRADRFVRAGKWLDGNFPLARTVAGRSLGIVGLGRIGMAIGRRAEAFRMQVLWHGPRPKPDVAWPFVADLLEIARLADFLMVICPLTPATRGLISAEVLAALGPEGTLVNLARGAVVDEPALVEALQSGTLGAAALDVFSHEPHVPEALLTMDNVVLQPHLGSATLETRTAMGQVMIDNLAAHFDGRPLPNRVA